MEEAQKATMELNKSYQIPAFNVQTNTTEAELFASSHRVLSVVSQGNIRGLETTQKSLRSVSHTLVLACQRLKLAPSNTSGFTTSDDEAIYLSIVFLDC